MRLYPLQLVPKILALLHHRNFFGQSGNPSRDRLETLLLQYLMTVRHRQIRAQGFAQRGPGLAGHIQRNPSLLFGPYGILHRRITLD